MSAAYKINTKNQEEVELLQILVIENDTVQQDPLAGRLGNIAGIEIYTVKNVLESREHFFNAQQGNTRSDTRYAYTSFDVVLLPACGLSDQKLRQEIALLSDGFDESDGTPKTIVVTSPEGCNYADLVEVGNISGTIPASYDTEQLLNCLRLVSSGVRFVPVESRTGESAPQGLPSAAMSEELVAKLTPRQLEVLEYVSLGKSNKHIATELSLCESTVKVHVHEVMKRLGATSRTHATYIVNTRYRVDSGGTGSSAMTA